MEQYHFQYCQKIMVFSKDRTQILLCKRKGEADYDGIFSAIGGKMEVTDESILAGLQREKNEEVGEDFKVRIYPTYSHNLLFRKKDGNSMILPYYMAIYESGEVKLNEEYSEYRWVSLDELDAFEPKIDCIPEEVRFLKRLQVIQEESEFVLI
jgi:NADH pyrophosphatase NudC (nudix superfamily)